MINTLAVKRAQIRGGAWSTAGKRVEKHLMLTLCDLFQVPPSHYVLTGLTDAKREVDFSFKNNEKSYRCEVKLMGKGNPESADAVIARASNIFIADTLSDLNKAQLDSLGVHWVELRSENGYHNLYEILQLLEIPCVDFQGDIDEALKVIFKARFG